MPRVLRDVGAALTCLQLLLLLAGVEPRPRAWDEDGFQLEAIKKGILERLGMPAPPVIRHRLDQESIRRAQRLYQQKVAELARNRSREEEGPVPGTRRLHRLTPTCKWPWLRVPSHDPRPRGRAHACVPHRVPARACQPGCLSVCRDMSGHEPRRSSLSRRLPVLSFFA